MERGREGEVKVARAPPGLPGDPAPGPASTFAYVSRLARGGRPPPPERAGTSRAPSEPAGQRTFQRLPARAGPAAARGSRHPPGRTCGALGDLREEVVTPADYTWADLPRRAPGGKQGKLCLTTRRPGTQQPKGRRMHSAGSSYTFSDFTGFTGVPRVAEASPQRGGQE